jgi:hypothetical protein
MKIKCIIIISMAYCYIEKNVACNYCIENSEEETANVILNLNKKKKRVEIKVKK